MSVLWLFLTVNVIFPGQTHLYFKSFGWYFYSSFNKTFCKQTIERWNSVRYSFAVSDIGLHCLNISHKKYVSSLGYTINIKRLGGISQNFTEMFHEQLFQSELPLPIPLNSVESLITWRLRHRNNANTISVIAAKQTVINEVYMLFFHIHKLYLFCWLNFSGNQKKILIGLNPHATELIFLTPVPANKTKFFRT